MASGWKVLDSHEDLDQLREASHLRPQLIFKHSTRCSVSSMARRMLESSLDSLGEKFDLHYLDLIAFRSVSNEIADTFGIRHESPQVLVISNGKSILDQSHAQIDPKVLSGLEA